MHVIDNGVSAYSCVAPIQSSRCKAPDADMRVDSTGLSSPGRTRVRDRASGPYWPDWEPRAGEEGNNALGTTETSEALGWRWRAIVSEAGATPVRAACQRGLASCAVLLTGCGADTEWKSPAFGDGRVPCPRLACGMQTRTTPPGLP